MTQNDAPHLSELRGQLVSASRRIIQRRRRRRLSLVAALGAGGVLAAAGIAAEWAERDVTPHEIAQTARVVENDKYLDCSSVMLGCVEKTATHKQADLAPIGADRARGVTFVLSDGTPVVIVPASGLGPALPTAPGAVALRAGLPGRDDEGRFHPGTIHRSGDAVVWPVRLDDGVDREVRWWRASGRIELRIVGEGGELEVVRLAPGDVVPLVGRYSSPR